MATPDLSYLDLSAIDYNTYFIFFPSVILVAIYSALSNYSIDKHILYA